jgi:hypothetical protein
MADTQVVDNFQQTETIPGPVKNSKNPPGRPRKDGLPAGITKPSTLPEDPYDFFALLKPAGDDWWNLHTIYVYRRYPITDRRGGGKLNWIDKLSEPVDPDYLMKLHGSGIYRLDLLEDGNKKIAETEIRIVNKDYPSVIPAGDWVDDPKNKDWEWCRPRGVGTSGNSGTGLSADDFLKLQAALGSKQDSGAMMIAALAPLLDPQRQTDMLATFASLMKPKEDTSMSTLILPLLLKMLDKPAGPDPMVTMLMEDRRAMREEMNRLREQQTAPKDTLDSLLENKEKFEALRGLFGKGGGTAAPEGWAGIADKAIDKLAGPVGQIGLIAAQRYMMQQPAAQQQALPRPAIQPAAVQVAPQSQPVAAQPEQQPQPAPVVDQQSVLVAKYQGVIAQAFPFLLDHFKDRDGYEFRDWFISPMRFGNSTWFQMRQEIGVDGFVNFLATLPPEIQAQLSPPEKFKTFMTEFFSDDDPEDQEGGDDDEEFSKPPAAE